MAFVAAAPLLLTALTAASTATAVAGTVMAASAAQSNAKYQSQVAKNQASLADWNAAQADRDQVIAEENAKRAGLASQEGAERQDRRSREEIGRVQGEQGASGLRGASQERQVATLRMLAGDDRMATRIEGDNTAEAFRGQARGFELEATDLRTRARFTRAEGAMAKVDGNRAAGQHMMSAAGSILGGMSTIAGAAQNPMARRGTPFPAGRRTASSIW